MCICINSASMHCDNADGNEVCQIDFDKTVDYVDCCPYHYIDGQHVSLVEI